MKTNDFRTLLESFNNIEEAGDERVVDPNVEYSEEGSSKIKTANREFSKVTAMVKGTTSEKLTKLCKRYLILDRAAKEFGKRRDDVKEGEIRPIFDLLFAAEDAALTRAIETVSLTIQMGKDVEESTSEKEVFATEKFMVDLMKLLDKDLIPVVEKLREKHTKLDKSTKAGRIGAIAPPKLKKESIRESIIREGMMETLKEYMSRLQAWVEASLRDFDKGFENIETQYNGRRPKF